MGNYTIYLLCALCGKIYIERKTERDGDMRKAERKQIEKFRCYLYEEEKSTNTIEKYLGDVEHFYTWLKGRGIDKKIVLEYKKALCAQYAPKSVNSHISSVNAFFNFMNWQEVKIKTIKIQKEIFSRSDREMTKSEYERLLAAANNKRNEKLYYIMQTIAATGIRISELRYITVETVKNRKCVIASKGKVRQIFLPTKLCRLLERYAKRRGIEEGSVFVTRSGRNVDRSNVWKMLKRLCKSARVDEKKVFPHNFRHLFARLFYAAEKDIVHLADILGHSSINTTRIYTMESGIVHKKQVEKLGQMLCQVG